MHMNKQLFILPQSVQIMALAALLIVVSTMPAFAQLTTGGDDAWVQPGVKIIEALESGIVTIGALVVGLGIIALGLWAIATLRMEWNKFWVVLIGGVLVMAGPKMITTLLKFAQSS